MTPLGPWEHKFRLILQDQLARGVPLVQRQADGSYAKVFPDGTKEPLPYRDNEGNHKK